MRVDKSRLDVVVFGGSGFTGRHAAVALARYAPSRGLQWGLAGRSRDRLHAVLADISQKTGEDLSKVKILVADINDEQTLRDMCEQAKVLVNCCGPYTLYGEPVVKAAIQSKTHYVDCTGEPNFTELMQLKYDEEARRAGVYVVCACAFESIPTDLGVLFLQKNFDGVLNSVESYLSANIQGSSINTGTWYSLIQSMPHLLYLSEVRKKLYPKPLPDFKPKLKLRFPIHKRFGGWCTWLPGNDSSAVYRTQRYFHQTDGRRPAQIRTYVRFPTLLSTLAVVMCGVLAVIMCHLKFARDLLYKYYSVLSGGAVTSGPSEEVIRNTEFEFNLLGVGWDTSEKRYIDAVPPRKSMLVKVSGKNPGYGMTVMGLLYSAITILEEADHMPPQCGVLTPGIAFSQTKLVQHLQENGVKFEIVDRKEKST